MGEEGLREVDAETAKEEEAGGRVDVGREEEKDEETYKNGIHFRFSTREANKLRCPRRYSSKVKPTFPSPGKTTVQANQTSKL